MVRDGNFVDFGVDFGFFVVVRIVFCSIIVFQLLAHCLRYRLADESDAVVGGDAVVVMIVVVFDFVVDVIFRLVFSGFEV